MNVVTGVSGSGKSTLVKRILHPLLLRHLDLGGDRPGVSEGLQGDLHRIQNVEFVDQNPIGKSSRSNPATYVKAWDDVRACFAAQPLSRNRGYKPSVFSFNTSGGRCDTCEGEGRVSIGMQFMADVTLTCDACKGKRFTDAVLEVELDGHNIHDILEMTLADASAFFAARPKPTAAEKSIVRKLAPLIDVGLGYVCVGQSATTLSGGEAQRIKLGAFLAKGDRTGHTVFIFDEPTTGLHFHDVTQLLAAFDALIKQGHTVICVEHNVDVMAHADRLLDLGPGGGKHGGQRVAMGTPEEVARSMQSVTSAILEGTAEHFNCRKMKHPSYPALLMMVLVSALLSSCRAQGEQPTAANPAQDSVATVSKSEAEWKEELPHMACFRLAGKGHRTGFLW